MERCLTGNKGDLVLIQPIGHPWYWPEEAVEGISVAISPSSR